MIDNGFFLGIFLDGLYGKETGQPKKGDWQLQQRIKANEEQALLEAAEATGIQWRRIWSSVNF